jgi:hypothetical protein
VLCVALSLEHVLCVVFRMKQVLRVTWVMRYDDIKKLIINQKKNTSPLPCLYPLFKIFPMLKDTLQASSPITFLPKVICDS